MTKICALVTSAFVVALVVSSASALAQGNGKGGGGGGNTPSFQVVQLATTSGSVFGMNDTINNIAELVGVVGEECRYWKVTKTNNSATVTTQVLNPATSGFMAQAIGINNHGVIVGYEYHPDGASSNKLVWVSGINPIPYVLPMPELPGDDPDQPSDWLAVSSWAGSISDDGLIAGGVHRRRPTENPDVIEEENYLVIWKFDVVDDELILLGNMVVDTGFAWPDPDLSRQGGWLTYLDGSVDGVTRRPVRASVNWEYVDDEVELFFDSWELLIAGDGYTTDISDTGIAVGRSALADSQGHYGFAIDMAGRRMTVPALPSFRISGTRFHYKVWSVRAINETNQVISYQWGVSPSGTLSRPRDVVSVLDGTSAIDLASFTGHWAPGTATCINNSGWIAGRVYEQGGLTRLPVLIIR